MWKLEAPYTAMDGYLNFLDIGYAHFTVTPKYTFKKTYINMKTRQKEEVHIHVNRIEGAWKHAKGHFKRMSETKINHFEGHLAEIMWRSAVKWDVYTSFFDLVKSVHPLDKPSTYKYMTPHFGLPSRLPVI